MHRCRALPHRPALVAALLAASLAPEADAQADAAARRQRDPGLVVGLVVDRETRQPIEGVAITVRLLDPDDPATPFSAAVLTDGSGRFTIEGLADGPYEIAIERIGYQRASGSMELSASLGATVDVELVREAVALDPLVVVAEAGSRYLDTAGFYDRASRGIGQFVTREQILGAGAQRMSDIFRTMPGVQVARGGGAGSEGYLLLRGGCPADLYIDGQRLIPPVSVDQVLRPLDVEGLEVYHGSEVPAAYRTTNCGAVLVWTHVPNPDVRAEPLSWKKVLAVLGLATFAIVISR